jgi:hypothetical protein
MQRNLQFFSDVFGDRLISLLSLKKENKAYNINVLSVWVPHPYILNQLVDFHGIQQVGHVIERDLDALLLIPSLEPFQNGRRSNF